MQVRKPRMYVPLAKIMPGVLLTVLLLLRLSVSTPGQQPGRGSPDTPDFTITVEGIFDAETIAEFGRRVRDYAALRSRLEDGLPPLRITENADEIEAFERQLGGRIRDARASRRFQIFVPAMEQQVKRLLVLRANPATVAAIMEDGPGEFDVDINDRYSKKRPLATMPPNILLLLPNLAPDMEYRFVGRHLIIRDARANIILDEIPYAIRCDGCVLEPEQDHDDQDTDPPERR